MSHVLAIAARELRERRNRIFLASATFAVLPFLAALLPGAKAMGRLMMISLTGGMLAVIVALSTGAMMGTYVVGRELTDKRLSFFFSRPVSAAAIWWGKVIGALATALSAAAMILIPSLLVGLDVWKITWTMSPKELVIKTVIGTVVLFFVAHAVSTMVRSRSPLLGLDVLLAVATAFALYLLVQPLLVGMAFKLLSWVAGAVFASLVLVLAIAPIWQLERGRTDRVKNHAALSLSLWAGVGLIIAAAAFFVLWVVSVSPADLDEAGIDSSPDGRTVMVAGRARNRVDYHAAFILEENGGTTRAAGRTWWWNGIEFSRDSRVAAWMEFRNPLRPDVGSELVVLRRGGKPERTGIRAGFAGAFALSDDGERVAVIGDSTLSVHDIRRGVLLASFRISHPHRGILKLFFLTPDVVHVVERYSSKSRDMDTRTREFDGVRVDELDVRTRRVATVIDLKGGGGSAGFSSDGRLLLMRGSGQVVEAETGRLLHTVANPAKWAPWSVILDDGTAVTRRRQSTGLEFEIQAPNAPLRVVPVPTEAPYGYVVILGQVAPKRLLITVGSGNPGPSVRARRALAILDVERGAITNVVENVSSTAGGSRSDPRLQQIDPTRIAALDMDGKPVSVNMLTGERRALVRE